MGIKSRHSRKPKTPVPAWRRKGPEQPLEPLDAGLLRILARPVQSHWRLQ